MILLVPFAVTAAFAQAPAGDLAFLLNGVKEIGAPGAPGNLCLFGPGAFPVVVGKEGTNVSVAIVAAARHGKGRVVIFGHDGYFTPDTHADTEKLLLNSLRWAGGAAGPGAAVRVALRKPGGLEKWLRKQPGITVELLNGPGWTEKLKTAQVLCAESEVAGTETEENALRAYIANGGGWVSGITGWGWAQIHAGKSLATEHHGNRVLFPAGLGWADGFAGKTTAKGFAADGNPSPLVNASLALTTLLNTNALAKINETALAQVAWSITQAARMLPPTDQTFLPRLKAITASAATALLPSGKHPLKTKDALARVLLTLQIQEAQRAEPEAVRAHPAAANFPGSVPATAKRVADRALEINTAVPNWHGTGLYAAPGEVIRVTVPESATGKKFQVRIGCHTDHLWNKDRWSRAPEVALSRPLKQTVTTVASAFGGPLYIDVPGKCDLGVITVHVSGGVEAPRYILGKTSDADWKTTQRTLPAPWAELECPHVILSVPSEVVRNLDNPEALMKYWDRVVAAEDELAGTSADRKRPERMVCDEQISVGYMHSGYPIMTHLDVKEAVLDYAKLSTKGSWGHFHELGHNHQSGSWTFEGTGEVTVNIFSLYIMETVVGLPAGSGHGAVSSDNIQKNIRKHLAAGTPYEQWKSDPFLALVIYIQLREGFGWDAFKKVFAEYRDLPPAQHPKSDDQKRDQWMVRFSKTVGKNLGPLFQTWGIPVSESARNEIKSLPAWMPPNFPPTAANKAN